MSELLDRMRQEDKRNEQRQTEAKAEPTPKKSKTAKSVKPQGKKKGKKDYYRINLALSQELGESIKAMAEAEDRSVNNYIERILLDHISK